MKVRVWNGDQSEYLGEGEYVGEVTVYYMVMPDGSLQSLSNAEEKPDQIPDGATLQESPGNPKIILDNGKTVYGCQVWWEPVKENVPCPEVEEDDPWGQNFKWN